MIWLATTGLCSYLVAVVAVRVLLARRWRGTRFVALDARRWNAAEWFAALVAALASVGVVGGSAAAAAGIPGPHLALGWMWAVPGVALMVGGVALMAWSQLTMGASWRIGVDRQESTQLVTTGPFRSVRNPIYASLAVFAAGVTMLAPTAPVGAGWLALVIFIEWQVRAVEEPFLTRSHGGQYLHWSVATGRFVPRVGGLR